MSGSPSTAVSLATSSRASASDDLWKRAVENLTEEEKQDIDFSRVNKLEILEDVLSAVEAGKKTCIQKQWKYRKGGNNIIIRDKLEKIVVWVNKFKQVGDTLVQYDPGHSALPWAGVRILLQITINDSQIYGAMIDGVEHVSNLIIRFTIIEELYQETANSSHDPSRHQLEGSIVKLYTAILVYLAHARRYYSKNTAKRMASAIVNTSDSTVDVFMKKIEAAQRDVDACLRLIDAEANHNISTGVRELQNALDEIHIESSQITTKMHKLESILSQLDDPIIRQATQISEIHDDLERKQRQELLQWLSTIQYPAHHRATGTGFLQNSCQWLLQKKQFVEWRRSSVSSVLWLRGIPGSGKTRLVYSIIEHIAEENKALASPTPMAFFYCVRAEGEPQRADPDEIMRCLLKQLSFSKASLPIREPVARAYKERQQEADETGCDPEKLSVTECEKLIISLLDCNPAVIVIDALDECDGKKRHQLMKALDNIIQSSASLVKVFISSREDNDIVCNLEGSPNILIDAHDNGTDIKRFVEEEVLKAVSDRRLLGGNVSQTLRETIIRKLIKGAQGMFRWVSLQIDNLCDPERIKHEKDIEQELGRLPQSLSDSYKKVHHRIKASGPISKSIADRAIAWLLCGRGILKSVAFVFAVSVDSDGHAYSMSQRDLLSMCCNLVIWDQVLDRFRFAHLSVQEYFQSQGEYDTTRSNDIILRRCFVFFTSEAISKPCLRDAIDALQEPDDKIWLRYDFGYYASQYWLQHYRPKSNDALNKFLFYDDNSEITAAFDAWMALRDDIWWVYSLGPLNYLIKFRCAPLTLLILAHTHGWPDILERLNRLTYINWDQSIASGKTMLQVFFDEIYGLKHELLYTKVMEFLLRKTMDVNYLGDKCLDIISWAGKCKALRVVEIILQAKYKINTIDELGRTALNREASEEHLEVIKLLLAIEGNDINVPEFAGWTPIKSAIKTWDSGTGRHQVHRMLQYMSTLDTFPESQGYTRRLDSPIRQHEHETLRKQSILEIVQELIKAGADVNAHFDGQDTPLFLAAEYGSIELTRILLDAGAEVNCDVSSEGAALRKFAESGNLQLFTLILMSSYSTDSEGRLCYTALQIAARNGHLDVVKALLSAGANVKAVNNFGWTAGDLAAAWGHEEIVQLLEGHGNQDSIENLVFELNDGVGEPESDPPEDLLPFEVAEINLSLEKEGTEIETLSTLPDSVLPGSEYTLLTAPPCFSHLPPMREIRKRKSKYSTNLPQLASVLPHSPHTSQTSSQP